MDSLLDNLILLMEQEILLWNSMNDLLVEKRKSVIDADVGRLEGLSQDIETLQIKIRHAENQRKEVFEKVALTLDCIPGDLNLKALSRLLPEAYAERIMRCRRGLVAIMGRIRNINAGIQELLTHAIHMVGASCNILSGIMSPHTVYGQTGVTENRNQIGRVLSQNV